MNASNYLISLSEALGQIDLAALEKLRIAVRHVKAVGGTLYVLGNGGSQANASHLVLHLINLGYRAHDLMAETAWLTATSNDYSYETTPGRRLWLAARKDDALIVISCSGDSLNILWSLWEAKRKGIVILGLLGSGGGVAINLCDLAVVLPTKQYGIVEDCHSAIIHILGGMLKQGIVPTKKEGGLK